MSLDEARRSRRGAPRTRPRPRSTAGSRTRWLPRRATRRRASSAATSRSEDALRLLRPASASAQRDDLEARLDGPVRHLRRGPGGLARSRRLRASRSTIRVARQPHRRAEPCVRLGVLVREERGTGPPAPWRIAAASAWRAACSAYFGRSLGQRRDHRDERGREAPRHRGGAAAPRHGLRRRQAVDERSDRQVAEARAGFHAADCRSARVAVGIAGAAPGP